MNIQQLYNEYKRELKKYQELRIQLGEYYNNELQPIQLASYSTEQLSFKHNICEQINKEKQQCKIKYNLLAKDIADELDGKIFKLSNGNYIAYDDNPDNDEYTIREYEVYGH